MLRRARYRAPWGVIRHLVGISDMAAKKSKAKTTPTVKSKAKAPAKKTKAAPASGKNSATLTDNSTGRTRELPIMAGSMGPRVIDVRRLYADTGFFTYDPGYTSTASCDSGITYIDGDEGILMHRGYAIEDLAEHSDYMEVCYLLLDRKSVV